MATYNISDDFGVTVSMTGRTKRGFSVIGVIFSRKTLKSIGRDVRGEGSTLSLAQNRAVDAARREILGLLPPEDDED